MKTLYRCSIIGKLRNRSKSIHQRDHGIPSSNHIDLRFREAAFPKPRMGSKGNAIWRRGEINAHTRPGNPYKASKGSEGPSLSLLIQLLLWGETAFPPIFGVLSK
jgi:hypothetical protein